MMPDYQPDLSADDDESGLPSFEEEDSLGNYNELEDE